MEDPLGAQRTMTLPQQITDQCAALNIPFTGVSFLLLSERVKLKLIESFLFEQNAAGKMSTTDLSGTSKGPITQESITGWTPKAKGALAGCIITALLGMLTVVWVSFELSSLFSA